LCADGTVSVNQAAVRKPNHLIRIGDIVAAPQGAFRRTVRVLALGARRGPAIEARQLYEEAAAPLHLSSLTPQWSPLLADNEPGSDSPAADAGRSQA
jgi:ribosome-associated heat shock protein Hsp15